MTKDVNELTKRIIGGAIEVHRHLGPSLTEASYEEALCIELRELRLPYTRQIGIPVHYKGHLVGEHRPDLVVADAVVVEVKSVEKLARVHHAQLLRYLSLTGLEVGLLLNFNEVALKYGIKRLVLQRGNKTL